MCHRRSSLARRQMYRLIMDGQETTYKDPEDPGKDATPGQVAVHKMFYEEASKDRLQYANDSKFKVFRLIVGQCPTAMRQKLEADPDYKEGRTLRTRAMWWHC
jgi:hypothetical protein